LNRDQKIFETYSLVIGAPAIVVLMYLGVTQMLDSNQRASAADTAEYQAAVADQLRPFGRVYLPGEEVSAGEPVVTEAEQPEPVETMMSGPQVYNDACLVCHGAGVGGAPILGDAGQWAARLEQGNDALYRNAIEGYTGESGFMPAKGARMDLSDDEVRAAVDYMTGELGN
jgi:cytochrome c5